MDGFTFRRLADDDVPALVTWMAAEHAQPWFGDEPRSADLARQHYAAELAGTSATRMWVVTYRGRDIGYVQDYPVVAYDDYAVRVQDLAAIAFDYLIGEPDLVDRGLGTAMITTYCREVLCRDYPEAPRFVASPDVRNARSIRVLEKCGFTQGLWIQPESVTHPEVVCTAPRELFERSGQDGQPVVP
ncbi:GNAT family N-acetyltransferase [Aeromicrobium sp. UC242_57]|uniref:GNAT family N-acetyltransferase n=1 Tax=Aeromicrobium sp. UC242_57 TaxID=3374624 RepID=UPI003790B53D